MNIIHTISTDTVERGDHVYVRQGFRNQMKRQGIILAGTDLERDEKWLVVFVQTVDDVKESELRCVSLEEFMEPNLKLRRALYDQGHSYLHHFKLSGTSYIETKMTSDVIVNNVKILYKVCQLRENQDGLKKLIGSSFENFSYVCCTTNSKDWTINFDSSNDEDFPETETVQSIDTMRENLLTERTHQVDRKDLKRGDHIYVWCKYGLYQHHGIVIGREDIDKVLKLSNGKTFTVEFSKQPNIIIEDLMVIENNRTKCNIRLVTLSQFAQNYSIKRVLYGMQRKRDMFRIDTKLSGKCFLEDALKPDEIVDNARFLYYIANGLIKNPEFSQGQSNVDAYNVFLHNCEHFAHICSTNKYLVESYYQDLMSKNNNNQNQIENKEVVQIVGESQQVKTIFNYISIIAGFIFIHTTEQLHYLDKIVPDSLPYLTSTLQTSSHTLSNCFTTFVSVAGSMIGIVAAINCAAQIICFLTRYILYKVAEKSKRKLLIACGLAIRGWDCIKGICKVIIGNGVGICFSLLAGAIGMATPVPVLNIVLSIVLSTVGFMIGHYIGGVSVNFIRRYYYRKEKRKKDTHH